MPPEKKSISGTGGLRRRSFLKTACGTAAGLAFADLSASGSSLNGSVKKSDNGADAMPKITVGGRVISRLVLGANPVWGYGHRGRLLDRFMVEYYTDDKIIETLFKCEKAGINTWQTNFPKRFPSVWRRYRDKGGKMNLIILYDLRETTIKEAASYEPMAIVHHGGVTDHYWKRGEFGKVKDFVAEVKDTGILAGISSHNPDIIDYISEEDWDNDLFMTCLYHITRTPDEWKKLTGFKPQHEMYPDNEPGEMCAAVRRSRKPCLAFKILAAGRVCNRKKQVEDAFRFAFQNIKPSDGVIVGMIPKFTDQIGEDIGYTVKYGLKV